MSDKNSTETITDALASLGLKMSAPRIPSDLHKKVVGALDSDNARAIFAGSECSDEVLHALKAIPALANVPMFRESGKSVANVRQNVANSFKSLHKKSARASFARFTGADDATVAYLVTRHNVTA